MDEYASSVTNSRVVKTEALAIAGCVRMLRVLSASLVSQAREQAPRLWGAGGKLSHRTRTATAGGGVFGEMDEAGRIGVQRVAQPKAQQPGLFDTVEPQWVETDLKRVRVEWARQFGEYGRAMNYCNHWN